MYIYCIFVLCMPFFTFTCVFNINMGLLCFQLKMCPVAFKEMKPDINHNVDKLTRKTKSCNLRVMVKREPLRQSQDLDFLAAPFQTRHQNTFWDKMHVYTYHRFHMKKSIVIERLVVSRLYLSGFWLMFVCILNISLRYYFWTMLRFSTALKLFPT